SAGASAAYLTVSEIFPLETRALAIAFFYAIGTAAGGIAGPLLFSKLVSTKNPGDTALGFVVGAILMILAGLVEIGLGVRAERRSLEDLAEPMTAQGGGAPPQRHAPEPVPVYRDRRPPARGGSPVVHTVGRPLGEGRPTTVPTPSTCRRIVQPPDL